MTSALLRGDDDLRSRTQLVEARFPPLDGPGKLPHGGDDQENH